MEKCSVAMLTLVTELVTHIKDEKYDNSGKVVETLVRGKVEAIF